MPTVSFTPHLKMHLDCSELTVSGNTLRESLDAAFEQHSKLRGYVLDDQKRLRKHVVIFIDDAVLKDREQLSDPVHPESQIYVMQALSGG